MLSGSCILEGTPMKLPLSMWAIGLCAFVLSQAGAEEYHVLPVSANLPQSPSWLVCAALGLQEQLPQPAPAAQAPPAQQQQAAQDAFAEAPAAGGEAPRGLNPNMIGDFPGTFVFKTITVPSVRITTQTLNIPIAVQDSVGKPTIVFRTVTISSIQTPVNVTTTTRVLAGGSGLGFKVADNQSPQPSDRAFFTYNYFGNIQGPSSPFATQQVVPVSTTTVPVQINSNCRRHSAWHNANDYREHGHSRRRVAASISQWRRDRL